MLPAGLELNSPSRETLRPLSTEQAHTSQMTNFLPENRALLSAVQHQEVVIRLQILGRNAEVLSLQKCFHVRKHTAKRNETCAYRRCHHHLHHQYPPRERLGPARRSEVQLHI